MSLELIRSFVATANTHECDFPLNNLPFGVCFEKEKQHCFSATAIGDQVLNLTYAEELGLIPDLGFKHVLLNCFMSKGSYSRKEIRKFLQELLVLDSVLILAHPHFQLERMYFHHLRNQY